MIRLRTKQSLAGLLSVILVALLGAACESNPNPLAHEAGAVIAGEAMQSQHGQRAAQADRQFYLSRIEPVGDTRVRGTAQFEIVGEWFTAKVRVTGVEPNERIPQHIHLNPFCTPAGGILINLDWNLTVGGEGPPAGEAYPRANRAGVVQYEARRPLVDLDAALQEHRGITLAELELAERNVNFHDPVTLAAVGCGEIDRIN